MEVNQLAILLAAGRYPELERRARALAQRHPGAGLVWKALGVCLKLQAKNALPAMLRAAQLLPTDAEAHSNLGIALLDARRMGEAAVSFRRALMIKPDFADAYSNLGNALVGLGRPQEALASYQRALALRPDNAEGFGNLGNALLAVGRPVDAIASCRRALQIKPDLAEAHAILGHALRRVGQMDEALASYGRALAIKPDFALVHSSLGDALRGLGRCEQAVASFRRALEIKPDSAESHNNLGNALMGMGEIEQAVASYGRALELAPNFAHAHCNLGKALSDLGRTDEAVASCRRALQINPDLAEAHSNLGNALMDLGRFDDAVASYESALAIQPGFVEVRNNLGNVLRSLGRLDEAVTHYRLALQSKPDYAEVHTNMGAALRLQGRTAEAIASCQLALQINPQSAAPLVVLAEAHADGGEFTQAQVLFKRAIALQPNLPEAWAGLAQLRTMTSEDAPWLAEVERIASQSLRPRESIALSYASGKYFDDLRDFDQAFSHYRRANELTRLHTPKHDRQRLTRAIDGLISLHDRAWMERARGHGVASARPVFVIGMPRSGTSLAEQILASHPQVFGAGELPFWSSTSATYRAHGSDGDWPEKLLVELGGDYLRQLQGLSADASRVIDKMPANFMSLALIHAALPGARIIHMRRDPIDTCLSIYFQPFEAVLSYANDLDDLAHYYGEYRRLMAHWQCVLPADAILDVPYESLVEDQEAWSRRMLEFIELPWDARCLDFHQTRRTVVTASKWQVRQKIGSASVARWRHYRKHLGPLLQLLPPDSEEIKRAAAESLPPI